MTFDDLVEVAQYRAEDLPDGTYLIGQIFGEYWAAIPDHQKFGIYFKEAVISNRVPNVGWVERRSDNNQLYVITNKRRN